MSERSAASLSAPNDLRALLDAHEQWIMIRASGDIIAMAPPLTIKTEPPKQLVGTLGDGFGGLN